MKKPWFKNSETTNNTKFWGLTLDNTLNWKIHIDLTLSKLNKAFYTIKTLKHTLMQASLIMIYFAYFHSLLNYGIIFWGKSRCSNKIFVLQKKFLRTITSLGNWDSCCKVFKALNILTLTSQYIYSVSCFVISNRDEFAFLEMHRIFTRQVTNFCWPMPKSTLYQIGITNMDIKIYNELHLTLVKHLKLF